MLGPELGPDEHLSSKICHCLLPSVYCLLSLLNSLPKKCFTFRMFISLKLFIEVRHDSENTAYKYIAQWVFTPV